MKRTISKRIRAMLLAALLTVTCAVLPACGSSSSGSSASGGESASSSSGGESTPSSAGEGTEASSEGAVKSTYPIEGNVTLSYASGERGNASAIMPFVDTPFWSSWQEQTGITLEFVQIQDFSLLMASGDYPDIICTNFSGYAGGVDGAIKDGIILPINDYLDTYASDYKARLDSNEEWAKGAVTPLGNYAGFYHLRTNDPGVSNSYGLVIRQDWLDDLGLEVPTTADEFVEVLRAFRDEKGATSPLTGDAGIIASMGNYGLATSPFGLVNTSYYQIDGTVHFGAAEPEYKDYLAWMNSLYEEGLMDRNFNTLDSATNNSNILNGTSGVTAGYAGGGIGAWIPTGQAEDPEYNLSGMSSLVANKGDTPMYNQRQMSVPGTMAAITTSCENVEAAVQFLNYGYTEAGNLLMQYGTEGVSYEMVDGAPHYTDEVLHNPDGYPFAQAVGLYAYVSDHGPYIQGPDFCTQSYSDAQNAALEAWTVSDVDQYYIPDALSIGADEADEYTSIKSEVDTYVSENRILFITGERSLDEFDDYLNTLKDLGVDRMIEIYQNAYDVYNS